MAPKTLTPDEAAAILGLTPTRVRQLCNRKQIACYPAGRSWLLDESAVLARAANPPRIGAPLGNQHAKGKMRNRLTFRA